MYDPLSPQLPEEKQGETREKSIVRWPMVTDDAPAKKDFVYKCVYSLWMGTHEQSLIRQNRRKTVYKGVYKQETKRRNSNPGARTLFQHQAEEKTRGRSQRSYHTRPETEDKPAKAAPRPL